ncbi:MAG: NnrU family protein [Rhodospirillales bacterium]|nr:NnrU family protein [Rhodospirillales bacterium]
MTGSLNALFAATVLFVGAHFLLSGQALRGPLAERLGEQGFRALYSVVGLASFLWMLAAYRDAPLVAVWQPPPALAWVPLVVMPFALWLAVAGVTASSPTMVGGEARLADPGVHDPAPGMFRVTRHPFLWGAALWAASHLLVNGDAASILLMGAILVLSLGGMRHIDQRREALGAAWGPVKLTTSAIPFAAILAGRTTMDWKGLGWWRPVLALALYAALLHAHPWLMGVSALPG